MDNSKNSDKENITDDKVNDKRIPNGNFETNEDKNNSSNNLLNGSLLYPKSRQKRYLGTSRKHLEVFYLVYI